VSEFAKRVIFAVIAAPAVLATAWLGGAPLAALLSLASAIGAWEFYRLAVPGGSEPLRAHGVLMSALVPLFVHARYLGLWAPSITILVLLVLELLTVALWVRGATGKPLEVVGITILGVFYTGGMLSFAYGTRYHPYAVGALAGSALVAMPMVLTWATDIGGFTFGRAFGRHKLMPSISPKKTIAGAVGGLALAVALSVLYAPFILRPLAGLSMRWWGAVLFGVALSVAAQVGDLVESMFKREAAVKDSSHLIPGHGGLLDRVDSLLFTLPIGYALFGWLLIPAP
jgi:phosphatidate cytidylyltransferase